MLGGYKPKKGSLTEGLFIRINFLVQVHMEALKYKKSSVTNKLLIQFY